MPLSLVRLLESFVIGYYPRTLFIILILAIGAAVASILFLRFKKPRSLKQDRKPRHAKKFLFVWYFFFFLLFTFPSFIFYISYGPIFDTDAYRKLIVPKDISKISAADYGKRVSVRGNIKSQPGIIWSYGYAYGVSWAFWLDDGTSKTLVSLADDKAWTPTKDLYLKYFNQSTGSYEFLGVVLPLDFNLRGQKYNNPNGPGPLEYAIYVLDYKTVSLPLLLPVLTIVALGFFLIALITLALLGPGSQPPAQNVKT